MPGGNNESVLENKVENKSGGVVNGDKEVDSCAKTTSYGTFKDAQALLKGYNDLQSEFTRRCQRVKELEGENAKLKEQISVKENSLLLSGGEQPFENKSSNGGFAVPHEKYSPSEVFLQKDNYSKLDNPESSDGNPLKKEQIVKDYLRDVLSSQNVTTVITTKQGGVALTPPIRPQSFAEVGKMAEKILRKK